MPGARPRAYADDIGATAPSAHDIHCVLQVTEDYAAASDMQISAGKSSVWGTLPELRAQLQEARVGGVQVPTRSQDRVLGAQLSFDKRRAKSRIFIQLGSCLRMCERIQGLPLSMERRAHLVGTFVIPKALYAVATCKPPKKALSRLSAACNRAIWGQANRHRCREILHTCIVPGHR